MNNKAILLAMTGAAMLAACGQPETENNAAVNNLVAVPANVAAPSDDGNSAEPANTSVAEVPTPAPRATPTPEPRPAPGTHKEIMPLERRVDRVEPAPKQQPSAPTSRCTPEHEAMGHCKQ